MSSDKTAFNQTYHLQITNRFENFAFDIMVFDVDSKTGQSKDFECYKEAVHKCKVEYKCHWNCDFGKTEHPTVVHLEQTDLKKDLKTHEDSNDKDRIIVIDNTRFPPNGARSPDNIIMEYSNHSTYHMKYNLRDISIYMGLASMILSFAIGALTYLGCKIRRDI